MGLPTILPYKMPTTEELPNNKVQWKADPNRAVLLIHDMQKYFLNVFHTDQSPVTELIHNIQLVRNACKKLGIPIVYTAQPGDQKPEDRALLTDFWGPGLEDNPSCTDIVDSLTPDKSDLVLTKWRYSAFHKSDLLERLHNQGRDQLIICGVYAHIGCLLTACDAFMKDIQPFFIADAVADFSYEDHRMALSYVSSRCGFTTTANKILHELNNPQPVSGVREEPAPAGQ
jgi:bifunctional isochorismate lyase / aryl carrier protein